MFAGAFSSFILFIFVGVPIYKIAMGGVRYPGDEDVLWTYCWCTAFLGGVIGFLIPYRAEIANKEAINAAIEAEKAEKNRKECASLDSLTVDLNALHETLNPLLDQAAIHIIHAETELSDDSVGAFWDEIESAARRLAQYNNSLATILRLTSDHAKRRVALPQEFQPKGLEPRVIPDGDILISRMAKVVKQARRNPQWEAIFQQRRTNSILVHGFENLGNALDSLQHAVSCGLHGLADTMHDSIERITLEHSGRVASQLNELAAAHDEYSRERRLFEQDLKAKADVAMNVLEDIEYRRRNV